MRWASGPSTRATTAPTTAPSAETATTTGLVLVERLDHVAPAVGGAGGRTGQVDQPDDLLEGDRPGRRSSRVSARHWCVTAWNLPIGLDTMLAAGAPADPVDPVTGLTREAAAPH